MYTILKEKTKISKEDDIRMIPFASRVTIHSSVRSILLFLCDESWVIEDNKPVLLLPMHQNHSVAVA